MRIVIIGCGYWGRNHLRLMRQFPEVDQVIVVEPHPARRASLAGIGGLTVFPDLTSALPFADAAVIATPPRTHAGIARQCLAAGVGVLVEKPLATSTFEAERLVELADYRGLPLMVGHTFEYNVGVWKLRELVESRELGDTYFIDCARLNLGLYQSDVNVIWDLAPHDISIVNFVLGSRPVVVQAWGSANLQHGLEDVATLRLQYELPHVEVQMHLSWLAPQKVRRVTVVGSRKMAVYNDLLVDERVKVFDKGVAVPRLDDAPLAPAVTYHNGGMVSPFLPFEEPLRLLDQHFLDCVRLDKKPQSTGESGAAVVRVIEAAQLSLHQGGAPVQLTDSGLSVADAVEARMSS